VLFGQPLLSVTFDDGWESVYTQAMPILQRDGIRTTQYVLSGTEKDPLYMSWAQIGAMQRPATRLPATACRTPI
jgi:peptidoglycan/xylan/chitin deacetylase (PgdA/CDA1 family)